MKGETGFDPDLLKRFPTSEPRPEGELQELERIWHAPSGWARLTVVNNNYIGAYYVGAAFLFFLLAGVLELVMRVRSEEHTSELQSLMRSSYAVFCLKKKT